MSSSDSLTWHPLTLTLTFDVRGIPRPQGSLRIFRNGGVTYSPTTLEWRHRVQAAAVEAMEGRKPFCQGVELRLGFDLPRPGDHFLPVGKGTKRSEPELRPTAPSWPTCAPDLDKLVRCVGDALTDAGVWKDDGQVVSLTTAKRYVEKMPGVRITIKELTE